MAKTLGQYAVHVYDDGGVLHSFLPGQEVPDWAAKNMGPHCFATSDEVDDAGDVHDGPPPQHGRGSGEDKWRAYAENHGVDVSAAEGRDDVIAALEAAGVPVE
jgi:hypothetical protein